ncbi:MAG: GtrA family protein [Candidatus Spechtbacterales bacterium]
MKFDIIGSFVIGFLIAVFFLILAYTTITILTSGEAPPPYYWTALVIFPALSVAGLVLVRDLKNRLAGPPAMAGIFALGYQFYKFILVGVLNTLLDLAVLNGLIVLTGIAIGWHFSLFKGASFTIAVVNSYFWNKFWTFRKKGGVGASEFGQFLAVSLVGLGINVGAASLLVNVVGPKGDMDPQLWANVGAVAAIAFSTIWNFIGYKFFVFKKT